MDAALQPQKSELEITYNGVTKPLQAEPHETIKSVLERAIQLFGITNNSHLLALFVDGSELKDLTQSVAAAGLKSGTHLQLRPSTVRGG